MAIAHGWYADRRTIEIQQCARILEGNYFFKYPISAISRYLIGTKKSFSAKLVCEKALDTDLSKERLQAQGFLAHG